jgi:hypothetical protein
MEISGEIHYANVEIDFDVDYLAEALATNHSFVDDVVMHNYVDEHMTGALEQIDNVALEVDELREQIRELSPDNNYVRINDLREVIDAQITHRVAQILSDVMKGIEERRKES